MSHSYMHNPVHLVFSTKQRGKLIPRQSQPQLWAYLLVFARSNGSSSMRSALWKTPFTC